MQKQAQEIENSDTLGAIKRFSQAMGELKGGFQPQLPLELALVELIEGVQQQPIAAAPAQAAAQPVSPTPPPAAKRTTSPATRPTRSPVAEQSSATHLDAEAVQRLRGRWDEFMATVRERCGPKEQASLRSIRDLAIGGDAVAIAFGNNSFTQGVISEARTKDAIASILTEILGQQVTVICQSGEKASIPSNTGQAVEENSASGPDPLLEYAVSELGAQVNESRRGADRN